MVRGAWQKDKVVMVEKLVEMTEDGIQVREGQWS